MKAGSARGTLLAAVIAGVLLAPAIRAETLQDAWARAAQQDRGLAAVRS